MLVEQLTSELKTIHKDEVIEKFVILFASNMMWG